MSILKAQLFSTDFLIGIAIFLVAFSLLTYYWTSTSNSIQQRNDQENLQFTAEYVSQLWFSQGYPTGWTCIPYTSNCVQSIGLADADGSFNWTKMWMLKNKVLYNNFQTKIGVTLQDIYFQVDNTTVPNIYSFGTLRAGAKNIVKVVRAGLLNKTIVNVTVLVSQ